jgi:hypothetical protein
MQTSLLLEKPANNKQRNKRAKHVHNTRRNSEIKALIPKQR